jgi:hypothetical protein
MDLVNVIISGLAVAVSVAALFVATFQTKHALRAAEAAEQEARTATEALRLGAKPEITATVEDHAPSSWHSLRLALRASPLGDVAAGDLAVEIPSDSRMVFTGSQYGVDGPSPSRTARTYEPLLVGGAPAVWRVQLGDEEGGATDFRVRCRLGGMTWTIAVPVRVPVDIATTVW